MKSHKMMKVGLSMKKTKFFISLLDGSFKEVVGYYDFITLPNNRKIKVGFDKSSIGWNVTDIYSGSRIPVPIEFSKTKESAKEFIINNMLIACQNALCGKRYDELCEKIFEFNENSMVV
jgi:hypothetical protein